MVAVALKLLSVMCWPLGPVCSYCWLGVWPVSGFHRKFCDSVRAWGTLLAHILWVSVTFPICPKAPDVVSLCLAPQRPLIRPLTCASATISISQEVYGDLWALAWHMSLEWGLKALRLAIFWSGHFQLLMWPPVSNRKQADTLTGGHRGVEVS